MSITKKGKSLSFGILTFLDDFDLQFCQFIRVICCVNTSLNMGKVQHILKPTISQKLEILKKFKSGDSINSICVNYKLHKSSVYRIIKQENSLKKFVRTTECGPGKRCTLKKAEYPRMEKMLYKWFVKQRGKMFQYQQRFYDQKPVICIPKFIKPIQVSMPVKDG